LAILLLPSFVCAAEFRPLEKITDGAYQYRLSRNSNAMMAVDSRGTLHATYWSGGLDSRPDAPSHVFYRSWTNAASWAAQQAIDHSEIAGVGHIGGRHSSLALNASGHIWVVWADHRHCTQQGSWIDNMEIYGNSRTLDSAFSSTDSRLTTSSSGTMGDNGYTPKIATDSTGCFSVAWHDYNANADVSDIYAKLSNALGVFNLSESMASMRLTSGSHPEYTVVDQAIDAANTRHLVWTGGEGSGVDLYYAQVSASGAVSTPVVLAAGATDYYDPPHVAAAPNGDVWVAYGDDATGGNEDIKLLRRRLGQSAFDAPVTIAADGARQYFPAIAIDHQNRVHLAWADERSGRNVYYAIYDPASTQLTQLTSLTSMTKLWARPSLMLDAKDQAYVLIEESIGISGGEIWFTTTVPQLRPSSAAIWQEYR